MHAWRINAATAGLILSLKSTWPTSANTLTWFAASSKGAGQTRAKTPPATPSSVYLGTNFRPLFRVQFSIITPSFRNSNWLKLCIASVADQEVELEHIVQDACSDDGTQEWLQRDRRVKAFIEKDGGMYDAVNRGFQRAQGEILAYLNCDEQYLPGALQEVWNYFQKHPEAEIVFADTVVIELDGTARCFRKTVLPLEYHTWVLPLCTLTCSTFLRRSVVFHREHTFDTTYKAVADSDWVLRAIQKRIPMAVLRHYTSAFTETGENLGLLAPGLTEREKFTSTAPRWVRSTRSLWDLHYKVRRLCQGTLSQAPFSYEVYTLSSPGKRVEFHVSHPVGTWRREIPAQRAV